jgi:hypothetical protein
MRILIVSSLWLLAFSSLLAQPTSVDLGYYLPQDVSYRADIPTPASVLGFQLGEWHVSHDKLVQYLSTVAAASDRMVIDTIGYTYEQRPLLHLRVSSPANLARLEDIRQAHLQLSDPAVSANLSLDELPVVVNMGYSVHGNEPSGSHASLLLAYYLAAAEGDAITTMLDQMVVIIDPSLNPDGLNRFAHWANSHQSLTSFNLSARAREHNESWPGGRTNHYWFDLNRDWLLVQHPESRARVTQFHRWKPNFLTDYHEMGSNNTYFFQPGIPSRNNPLTPAKVFDLTRQVAGYHAKALDQIGSLYYTEESFDDFYYGKGSTYPDINGGVGILFEQASSRGHAQETDHGILTLAFTIRNQITTSLSTLAACQALRLEMLTHQRDFYQSALKEAAQDARAGFVFTGGPDLTRSHALLALLLHHQIEVKPLTDEVMIGGQRYAPQEAFFVPLAQPQYRLVRALFEQPTEFTDSLFYDVSAWTLPLAFGLPFSAVKTAQIRSALGDATGLRTVPAPQPTPTPKSSYAYAFEWHGYYAPRALNRLFEAGLRAKVATSPFVAGGHAFARGSILLPLQGQPLEMDSIHALMTKISAADELTVYALPTGLTEGVNLGSPSFEALTAPKVLLVVGEGASGYETGEVWHLLDQRIHLPLTLVEMGELDRVDLDAYTTIVMVNGSYGSISAASLRRWMSEGGTLIATKSAVAWAASQGIGNLTLLSPESDTSLKDLTYANQDNVRGAQVLGGAICQARLDRSHPLGYGFQQDTIAVFRNSTRYIEASDNPAITPLRYTQTPLMSGYASPENVRRMAGTGVVNTYRVGQGRLIAMVDNPNFRAFWYGTNKLFLNAIFFGDRM